MKSKLNYDALFWLIYISVSLATFSHTIQAIAFFFEGSRPESVLPQAWWWISGVLPAMAIDFGMFVAALLLQRKFSVSMFAAFLLGAAASAYTQILFAVQHIEPITFGAGVTEYWIDKLTPWIEARVLIIPLALPVFVSVYTWGKVQKARTDAKDEDAELLKIAATPRRAMQMPQLNSAQIGPDRQLPSGTFGFKCELCGEVVGSENPEQRLRRARNHMRRKHKDIVIDTDSRELAVREHAKFFEGSIPRTANINEEDETSDELIISTPPSRQFDEIASE